MCLTMSMIQECELLEILEEREEFEAQFVRYRGLVRFAVCRLLSDPEQIEAAVENCFLTAFRHPMSFGHAGKFRRWLVRIAIDEASEIRRRKLFSNEAEFRSAAEYWMVSIQDGDPL
jgi:DNA-directed RNA polymerase specialized sigma24 family protein